MVHQYMACMGVLNDYLAYLPMVYNSSMAVEGTKKCNVPFDEADLAGIILKLVLVTWMNQCNMLQSTLPKPQRVGGPVQDFPPFVFFLAGTIFFKASPN
jgi:hypothetical protein